VQEKLRELGTVGGVSDTKHCGGECVKSRSNVEIKRWLKGGKKVRNKDG